MTATAITSLGEVTEVPEKARREVEPSMVTRMSLWRRMRCTAAGFAPNIIRSEAVVWRVSWKRMGSTLPTGQSFMLHFGQRRRLGESVRRPTRPGWPGT